MLNRQDRFFIILCLVFLLNGISRGSYAGTQKPAAQTSFSAQIKLDNGTPTL